MILSLRWCLLRGISMQKERTSQSDTLRQWHMSGSGENVLTEERLHVHLGDLDGKQETAMLTNSA